MDTRTAEDFFTEVNRQAASGHLALTRWIDEVAEANRALSGAMVGLQTTTLRTVIDAGAGALEGTRGTLDAGSKGSQAFTEQWIETAKQWQSAWLRLGAASGTIAVEAMKPRS